MMDYEIAKQILKYKFFKKEKIVKDLHVSFPRVNRIVNDLVRLGYTIPYSKSTKIQKREKTAVKVTYKNIRRYDINCFYYFWSEEKKRITGSY